MRNDPSRRRDLIVALAVACVSLVSATTATAVVPTEARWIAAFASVAACLLAGSVAALALRLRDGPDRNDSARGLGAAALGYGLALSVAANGPGALRTIVGLVRLDAPVAAVVPATLLLAAWMACSTRRLELRIDPATTTDPGSDGDEETRP